VSKVSSHLGVDGNVRPLLQSNTAADRICVATYVFGEYDVYIPYFVYSVLRSYPAYYCKVFIAGHLRSKIARALDIVRRDVSERFDITRVTPHDLLGIPSTGSNRAAPNAKYAARWFLPRDAFAGFDHAYMGDVDFLIVPEYPSLSDQHVAHIQAWGLPFSNARREGTRKLTGLHFVKVDPYFDAIEGSGIRKLADLPGFDDLLRKPGADESILYEFMDVVFGVSRYGAPEYRPYHGFHLSAAEHSLWRLAFDDNRHRNTPDRWGRFGGNTYSRELLMQSMKALFFRDPTFWRLYGEVSNAVIDRFTVLAGTSPLDTIRRAGTAFTRLGSRRIRRMMRRIGRRLPPTVHRLGMP